MFGTNADSEWVAEPVPVSVEAGKVTRDVQVTAQRGALLEVTVLGKENRKPMAKVNVTAYRENSKPMAFPTTTASFGCICSRAII